VQIPKGVHIRRVTAAFQEQFRSGVHTWQKRIYIHAHVKFASRDVKFLGLPFLIVANVAEITGLFIDAYWWSDFTTSRYLPDAMNTSGSPTALAAIILAILIPCAVLMTG
jgi:hypothetical protein